MTPSCTPTIEQIKSGAKSVKNTLLNRFGITVNHTQALELSAVAYGYKDFHVASGMLRGDKPSKKRKNRSYEEEFMSEFVLAGVKELDEAGYAARFCLYALRRGIEHFDWGGFNPDIVYSVIKAYSDFIFDMCETNGNKEGKKHWVEYFEGGHSFQEILDASNTPKLMSEKIAFILGLDFEEACRQVEVERMRYNDILPDDPDFMFEFGAEEDGYWDEEVKIEEKDLLRLCLKIGFSLEQAKEFYGWLQDFNGGYIKREFFYDWEWKDANELKIFIMDVAIGNALDSLDEYDSSSPINSPWSIYTGSINVKSERAKAWREESLKMIEDKNYMTKKITDALGLNFQKAALAMYAERIKHSRSESQKA